MIIITGPTATGKTKLAVALAKELYTQVISADSMQVYQGLDIGTAKPAPAELEGVAHHMLDVCDPREDFSVARYVALTDPIVQRLLAQGNVPIIAGGTGQYIDALMRGLDFPPFSGQVRSALSNRLNEEGIEPLYAELQAVDPERAARLAIADHKRILRGLEVYLETGDTITNHDRRSAARPPRYEGTTFVLQYANRADLYARIDARVDDMLAQGLLDEVAQLLAQGLPVDCTAMQAIGYKELVPVVQGACPLADAVTLIKQRSRNYAKRQLTWHRRNPDAAAIVWQKNPDIPAAVEQILCATQH